MKTQIDFKWLELIEELVETDDEFYKIIPTCKAMLEKVNALIPKKSHLSYFKHCLSLTCDLLEICQKQIFRLGRSRRHE